MRREPPIAATITGGTMYFIRCLVESDMTRYIKRGGQIWIRIFPHTSVTRKAQDTKMGSGKGNPEFFVAKVKPGTVLFEMDGVSEETAREAMRLAAHKLPVKTSFAVKEDQ